MPIYRNYKLIKIKNMNTIQIPTEIYIDMLNDRKSLLERDFGLTKMQDFPAIWEYVLDRVRAEGVSSDHTDPRNLIANIIVNGDYGSFDSYKYNGETDEDFIYRMNSKVLFIDTNERSIALSFHHL
jgi:hypothetical protein